MTRPAETPGPLFNLLALYAQLDRAVIQSGNPEIAAIVEGFLPGTTGENERGWSVNLQNFLGRPFPDVSTALYGLVNETPPDAPLTPPELSRLVYVLGSLVHLPTIQRGGELGEMFVQGLSLAQPQPERLPEQRPEVARAAGAPPDPGQLLLEVLEERFHNHDDWPAAKAYAVQVGALDKVVARVPPCNACLTTQGGAECVVVDTHFEDEQITLDQVTAILDPRNWAKTAGRFFCEMLDLGTRNAAPYQGWGRVLETVSVSCPLPLLRTDLKYFKADYTGQAVLQFDLDDPFPGGGDGLVTVDKGWLKVATGTSNDSNAGVTVTTRKVVHIDGLLPVAQKMFVCESGYGQAAWDMVLGHATNPPPDAVPWSQDPKPLEGGQAVQQATAFLTGGQAVQAGTESPVGAQAGQPGKAPAGKDAGAAPTTAAGLAVSMLSDYLAEVTNDSSKLVAKFANRELIVDDLAKFSAKLGASMASQPWRFMQKLAELPPHPPTGGLTQDGDNA
jgi:hypothetical protein